MNGGNLTRDSSTGSRRAIHAECASFSGTSLSILSNTLRRYPKHASRPESLGEKSTGNQSERFGETFWPSADVSNSYG